jgi:stage V sporulation protein AF
MAEKTVEEFILGSKLWNPFPRVRYTERPDVATIHLLEGNVIIMVDTSPSVIIAPVPSGIMSNMPKNTPEPVVELICVG